MPDKVRSASADEMPILDLTALYDGGEIAPIAAKLRQACLTTGFFYVFNHGIPESVVAARVAGTKTFFAPADGTAARASHRREVSARIHAAGNQSASGLRGRSE